MTTIFSIMLDDRAAQKIAELKKRSGNISDVELFQRAMAMYDVCLAAQESGGLTINGEPMKIE